MPGFKFSLQNFLSLREKIENQKKMEYGLANAKAEDEKQKKQKMVDHKTDNIDELRKDILENYNPNTVVLYNRYINRLKEEITEQDKAVKKAVANAESKRERLVEAMKDRKMLDTLKEKKYDEYVVEEKKAEQKTIDELVSYRYN